MIKRGHVAVVGPPLQVKDEAGGTFTVTKTGGGVFTLNQEVLYVVHGGVPYIIWRSA